MSGTWSRDNRPGKRQDQDAIVAHHASPMMRTIVALREKYDLHMNVERYVSVEVPESENRFVRT